MELSIHTLQFTDFLVFLCCGTIFLWNWFWRARRAYFLFFAVSFLNCALMSVWFVDFGYYGSIWSPFGWSIAGSTFWIGLRLFDGRPGLTGPLVLLALCPTGVHLLLTLSGCDAFAVNAGSTLAYAAHEAAVAHYVLARSPDRSPLRRLVGVALLAIAVAICLPLLPLPAAQIHSAIVAIFVVDQTTSIVLTTSILALEAEKAHAVLERMARTDPLTGILNREGLAAELSRNRRGAGICAVDLDHFKSINDRYGHSAGDEVLREFARRAALVVGQDGYLARLGGEEFGVVLPGFGPNATAYMAERIRHAASARPFDWKGMRINATVSLGTAAHGPDRSFEASFEEADRALYEAKSDGRNRVRSA